MIQRIADLSLPFSGLFRVKGAKREVAICNRHPLVIGRRCPGVIEEDSVGSDLRRALFRLAHGSIHGPLTGPRGFDDDPANGRGLGGHALQNDHALDRHRTALSARRNVAG